jgi:hypothetical protein
MPNFTTLTLPDRQDPVVNHDFEAFGRDQNGVATFQNGDGRFIGDKTLTVSAKRNAATASKVRMVLKVPVVQDQTENGITQPVVLRTSYLTVEASFGAGSTPEERADLMGFATALVDGSVTELDDVFINVEQFT